MTEAHRWQLIAGLLSLTAVLSLADVALAYAVPGEFYPMVGLVLGATIARAGGVNDVND